MTNPFKPISRVNLHSEVMQQITAAIQSGQWKPGSKLPGEIALAEMFQVSRTCIREVLKALAYSGVVESRSGVGTFVKEIPSEAPSPAVDLLSSTDYTQILEMRKLLEGQAAYWATERATPEEIAVSMEAARMPVSLNAPLQDDGLSEDFFCLIDFFWKSEECDEDALTPLLDAVQRDETLAEMVFRSHYVCTLHLYLIQTAI